MNGRSGKVASAARRAAARAAASAPGSAATAIPAAPEHGAARVGAGHRDDPPVGERRQREVEAGGRERPRVHVAAESTLAGGETVDADDAAPGRAAPGSAGREAKKRSW